MSLQKSGYCIGFTGMNAVMVYEIERDEKLVFKHCLFIDYPNIFKVLNMHQSDDGSKIVLSIQHSNRSIN